MQKTIQTCIILLALAYPMYGCNVVPIEVATKEVTNLKVASKPTTSPPPPPIPTLALELTLQPPPSPILDETLANLPPPLLPANPAPTQPPAPAPFPTKYLNLNPPTKLALHIPAQIMATKCSEAFSIWSLDKDGYVLNVEKDVKISLSYQGKGYFFKDSNCRRRITRLTIEKGMSDKKFWFKSFEPKAEALIEFNSKDLLGDSKFFSIEPKSIANRSPLVPAQE
jgi:hypothetical protein